MRTVLFEDGDWRICRIGRYLARDGTSMIYHKCKDEFNLNQAWWHIGHRDKSCVWCNSDVPDPIMGLFILHNWDRP